MNKANKLLQDATAKLHEAGALNTANLPPVLTVVADALPAFDVVEKMRYTAALNEIVLFAGMLRKNINHWNGSSVPVNTITFIIGESGSGKDKAAKGVRKCFDAAYKLLGEKREFLAKAAAIKTAMNEGEEDPSEQSVYLPYYKAPEPLFNSASSTVKGLTGHFNRLEEEGIGAGYITSMEIGSALEGTNAGNIHDLIEFISELYDTGGKEIKLIGDKAEQLKPINNFPVTVLFGGAPDNLLYDEAIKKKFVMQFATKLARRSIFNFNPVVPRVPHASSISELIAFKRENEATAKENREHATGALQEIAMYHLDAEGAPIDVDLETEDLFYAYEEYNQQTAAEYDKFHAMCKIGRQHAQWRALKIAGALAIFAQRDSIAVEDYVHAINICELFSEDLAAFEDELIKEPYELFADYMRSTATDGNNMMTIHELRKHGYIKGSTSKTRLAELATNASSYDNDGVFTTCEEGVCFKAIERTPITGISYLTIDTTKIRKLRADKAEDHLIKREKQKIARHAATGYHYEEAVFADWLTILEGDFAYSPFEFKDGVRGNDTITSGTKTLVLDIDNSKITADEMHTILADLNHIIALSSDASNPFKFRLLIELEAIIDIPARQWMYFLKSVEDDLCIIIDQVAKGQIYYSYQATNILTVFDQQPLEVKDHLLFAAAEDTERQPKQLTAAQSKAALEDSMDTFDYAYECPLDANGTKALIRAAFEANRLGATNDEIIALLEDIHDYWVAPMSRNKFENTILTVVKRF